MKTSPHDIAALLCSAAAALETPSDLTANDIQCLIADLCAMALEITRNQPQPYEVAP